MSTNDPYHVPQGPQATDETPRPGGLLRPVLWLLFAIAAAGNVVASSINASIWAHLGIGLVTLAVGVALGVHHFRHRRS